MSSSLSALDRKIEVVRSGNRRHWILWVLVPTAFVVLCRDASAVGMNQVVDPGEATHTGGLLTARFGEHHDQVVPEVWEHPSDYLIAHQQAGTTPGPIDRAFGAFTVRNENDTDGDGLVDNTDDDVRAGSQNNRDEVDLIKLSIVPPIALDTLTTITLTSFDASGQKPVVYWKFKTKTEKFGDGSTVVISSGAANQAIEVWAELPTQTPTISGWTIYCGLLKKDRPGKTFTVLRNDYDRISATSIWAESDGAHAGRHETQVLACPSSSQIVVPNVAEINMNPGDWAVLYNDHDGAGPPAYDSATDSITVRILLSPV